MFRSIYIPSQYLVWLDPVFDYPSFYMVYFVVQETLLRVQIYLFSHLFKFIVNKKFYQSYLHSQLYYLSIIISYIALLYLIDILKLKEKCCEEYCTIKNIFLTKVMKNTLHIHSQYLHYFV